MDVKLRETTGKDLDDLLALWNDGAVMQWVQFPDGLGYTIEKMRAWHEQLIKDPHRPPCAGGPRRLFSQMGCRVACRPRLPGG